ncbi:MAG: hypothetical protein QG657_3667 [Acidobacteriota bacterium]|nr:hypothetical protein [Acidobacteriota bacterium]
MIPKNIQIVGTFHSRKLNFQGHLALYIIGKKYGEVNGKRGKIWLAPKTYCFYLPPDFGELLPDQQEEVKEKYCRRCFQLQG